MSAAFDEYWQTIQQRNGWTPETKVEVTVAGLRKLAEQAWSKGEARGNRFKAFLDQLGKKTGGP